MFLVWSCCCLCPIHWSQVLSWEWRCSWSSAARRCSNYIRVINNFIAYSGAPCIRGLTVGHSDIGFITVHRFLPPISVRTLALYWTPDELPGSRTPMPVRAAGNQQSRPPTPGNRPVGSWPPGTTGNKFFTHGNRQNLRMLREWPHPCLLTSENGKIFPVAAWPFFTVICFIVLWIHIWTPYEHKKVL